MLPDAVLAPSLRRPLAPRIAAAREAVRYYGAGLLRELMTKDIFLWAQAVAFKGLISLVPLLLLATGIVGRVLQRDKPYLVVEGFVRDLLPAYQTQQTLAALSDLSAASGTITVAGSIGLLVTAVSLMTTLRAVVSNVFREDYHRARSFLGGYAFDARMVLQVGLFFLLSITLTALLGWLGKTGSSGLDALGLDGSAWVEVVRRVGILLPFLLTVGMFAQLYISVPSPRPPMRSVFHGAFVAAVLWEIAKQAFTGYAVSVGRFNVGTTFGLVLALVVWVYFSGLVLCVGALVVLLSEKRARAAALLPATPPRIPVLPAAPRFAPAEVAPAAVPAVPAAPPAVVPAAMPAPTDRPAA